MTVQELIARLQSVPLDWEVRIQDAEFGSWDALDPENVELFPDGVPNGSWQEAVERPFLGIGYGI